MVGITGAASHEAIGVALGWFQPFRSQHSRAVGAQAMPHRASLGEACMARLAVHESWELSCSFPHLQACTAPLPDHCVTQKVSCNFLKNTLVRPVQWAQRGRGARVWEAGGAGGGVL